jgi:hypothetical protein
MNAAIRARAANDKMFRVILKSTGKAILVHQTRGVQDVRLSVILHTVRDELHASNETMDVLTNQLEMEAQAHP